MSAIQSLQPEALTVVGILLVTTENGSLYRLDFNRLCVSRNPDLATWPGARLRRDDEDLRLLGILPIVVGAPMTMMLDLREDGVPTARQTGYVTSIEWLA